MNVKDLKFLHEEANRVYNEVEAAIIKMTKDNPLQLFTQEDTEKDDFCDKVYEYPYGYFVSKHGFYVQGAVQKISGSLDVTLFLTGEDWGEEHTQSVSELPFESQIMLLTYLIERL